MPIGLEAQQVRAIFFPKRKHFVFHRINIEYLVPLKSLRRESIYRLLDLGLRNNLKAVGAEDDIILSLRPQLEHLAQRMAQQGLLLARQREDFRAQLVQQMQKGFHWYRAEVQADLANLKLAEALEVDQCEALEQVLTAEYLLKNTLYIDKENYRAHFELAWIYLTVLERLDLATEHFHQACHSALQQGDSPFVNFTQRHLADTYYSRSRFGDAVEQALASLYHKTVTDLEVQYEYIRYLAAAGEVETATKRLGILIQESPIYYIQAQAEPDFQVHGDIKQLLQDLRQTRLDRVTHAVYTSWHNHPVAQMKLGNGVDSEAVFRGTLRQHIKVMNFLPYVPLKMSDNYLANLVINDSANKVMAELNTQLINCEQSVELVNQHSSWLHQAGSALLYSSVVLLIGCLVFLLIGWVLQSLGINLLAVSFNLIVSIILSVLPLLVMSLVLVSSIPKKTRQLLAKQHDLDGFLNWVIKVKAG